MPESRVARNAASLRRAVTVVVVALLVVLTGGFANQAQAEFATGGSGRFGSSLEWITWGADGQAIPDGGDRTQNTFVVGDQAVSITCKLSVITDVTDRGSGSLLHAYRSGDYATPW